jgi:hypothetical protein
MNQDLNIEHIGPDSYVIRIGNTAVAMNANALMEMASELITKHESEKGTAAAIRGVVEILNRLVTEEPND